MLLIRRIYFQTSKPKARKLKTFNTIFGFRVSEEYKKEHWDQKVGLKTEKHQKEKDGQ